VQVLPVDKLPPSSKYCKEAWEATIVRDYFDHLAESSAHLLDETLKVMPQPEKASDKGKRVLSPASIAKYLIEAAWWMEVVLRFDMEAKTHVSKNLGLAYMHLVRLKDPPSLELPRIAYTDIFEPQREEVTTWFERDRGVDWKTWATTR